MKKVPFIPQFNSTECGVCVLAMILHYFGAYHSMYEIRNYLTACRDGITIRRLIEAFEHYGIKATAYHGVIDNTSTFSLPAIVTWENNHYVIIERIDPKYVFIVDSNFGKIKLTYEEFNKSYSGIVILLCKTDKFIKKQRRVQFQNSFSSILKHYKKNLILLFGLSLLAQLFTFFLPITIQYLIDGLFKANVQTYNILIFISVVIFNSIFLYLKKYYITTLGVNFDREVSEKIMEKVLKVKYTFYDIKSNAEILFALENVSCVKNIYLDNVFGCIFDVLLVLFIFLYLFHANIAFGGMIFIALIPNVILFLCMDRFIQRDMCLMLREYKNVYGKQLGIISSILGIKASSTEQAAFSNWVDSYNIYYKKSKDYYTKVNTLTVILSTIMNLLPIIALISVIAYAKQDSMTFGMAMTFYTMANLLFGAVNTILNNIRNLRDNLTCFERIEDIMQCSKEYALNQSITEINLGGDIQIDKVNFKYSEVGEYVLKDISCTIRRNSKVAIIGESGSGKSTFLKVLAGLYKAESGSILYNNKCMNCESEMSIRSQIGFVAQNTWPMNQSIKEYMLLGLDNITMADIENACKVVNVHDEIMRMPMNYHTIIAENGKNISGGQCQRIMLAKMVLLDPQILLLDEATSALDEASEEKIFDYFFKKKCTVIMTTHKLSYLKNCDEIFVMKDGLLIAK